MMHRSKTHVFHVRIDAAVVFFAVLRHRQNNGSLSRIQPTVFLRGTQARGRMFDWFSSSCSLSQESSVMRRSGSRSAPVHSGGVFKLGPLCLFAQLTAARRAACRDDSRNGQLPVP